MDKQQPQFPVEVGVDQYESGDEVTTGILDNLAREWYANSSDGVLTAEDAQGRLYHVRIRAEFVPIKP